MRIREVCRVGLEVVVLRIHELLVPQVLGVRVLEVVVSQPDLVVDGVDGLVEVLWLQIVHGVARGAERLGQRVSLQHRGPGDEAPRLRVDVVAWSSRSVALGLLSAHSLVLLVYERLEERLVERLLF